MSSWEGLSADFLDGDPNLRELRARTLVPIHTENPSCLTEQLRDTNIEVQVLGYGDARKS